MSQIRKKAPMAFPGGLLVLWYVLLVGAHSQSAAAATLGSAARPRFADYLFEFTLVEDTIIPSQLIWLRIAQTNKTDHEVPRLIMQPGAQAFSTWFSDNSGRKLNVAMPSFYAISPSDEILQPGETKVLYWDFGVDLWDFTPETLHVALEGRRLALGVEFHSYVFADPSEVSPTILLKFDVCAPGGFEADAVRLLGRAREESLTRQGRLSRATCRELLDRYPNSRLVERAIRLLDFLGPGENARPPFRVDLVRELIRLKPGSPELIRMARIIKSDFGAPVYDSLLVALRRADSSARPPEVLKEEK